MATPFPNPTLLPDNLAFALAATYEEVTLPARCRVFSVFAPATSVVYLSWNVADAAAFGGIVADHAIPIPAGAVMSFPVARGEATKAGHVRNPKLAAATGTPDVALVAFDAGV